MKKYPLKLLEQTGLPVAYGTFEKVKKPPFIVFIGSGQDTFTADNVYYYRQNRYQVEYYYRIKNEEMENSIEELFMNNGILYEKSEDTYIQEDDMWVIYYEI